MIWIVSSTDVVVSDEFARTCKVFEMFRDETDTWVVPLPIHREIAFLNDLAITRATGGTVALHVAKHDTPTLLATLDAADYLDCDLSTDIASELARRLEGKSPRDMAEILDKEYTENAKLEYAIRHYLVPLNAVTPWPSSD